MARQPAATPGQRRSRPGGGSGFELAFKADALWVSTSIDSVDGRAGRAKATDAAETHFRTGPEDLQGYRVGSGLRWACPRQAADPQQAGRAHQTTDEGVDTMIRTIAVERELLEECRKSAREQLGSSATEAEVEAIGTQLYEGPPPRPGYHETEAQRQRRETNTRLARENYRRWLS